MFISYVREDADRVARLVDILKGAGLRVWLDVDDIWPGQDWKMQIKKAINQGSFAFIACFSERSEAKGPTFQNEELILAAEQMRLRPPGRTWLIPVRFSDCEIPEHDLSAGRTLHNINYVDLFDDTDWSNAYRLVSAVTTILRPQPTPAAQQPDPPVTPASAGERLKNMLLDPAKEIAVEDLVNDAVGRPNWLAVVPPGLCPFLPVPSSWPPCSSWCPGAWVALAPSRSDAVGALVAGSAAWTMMYGRGGRSRVW